MSDLLTPHQVQEFMLDKSKELDDAANEYTRRIGEAIEAERVNRIAMNASMQTVDGKSADVRRAKVEQACEESLYRDKLAAGLRDSAKVAWQTKLAQLNAGQSLSSTVREEMRLAR